MTGPAGGLREPPPAAPARAPPGAPAALFTVRTAPEDGRGQGRGRARQGQLPRVPRPPPGVLRLRAGEPARDWPGTQ